MEQIGDLELLIKLVAAKEYKKHPRHIPGDVNNRSDKESYCLDCGTNHHRRGQRKIWPALNEDCSNCGRRGHFGQICLSKKRKQTVTYYVSLRAKSKSNREDLLQLAQIKYH